MLMDLKGPLKQGDKLPVTLEFEKAGKVKLAFDVQGVGAKGRARAIPAVTTVIPAQRSEAVMSRIIILAAIATSPRGRP
jgi:hypothetical protein